MRTSVRARRSGKGATCNARTSRPVVPWHGGAVQSIGRGVRNRRLPPDRPLDARGGTSSGGGEVASLTTSPGGNSFATVLPSLRSAKFVVRREPAGSVGVEKGRPFGFFVIGDFGTGDRVQRRVAQHLSAVATTHTPQLVLSTGDNSYGADDKARAAGLDGVSSARDPSFQRKFERVYPTMPGLRNVSWFLTLGNHDCAGNSMAQVSTLTQHSLEHASKYTHSTGRYIRCAGPQRRASLF